MRVFFSKSFADTTLSQLQHCCPEAPLGEVTRILRHTEYKTVAVAITAFANGVKQLVTDTTPLDKGRISGFISSAERDLARFQTLNIMSIRNICHVDSDGEQFDNKENEDPNEGPLPPIGGKTQVLHWKGPKEPLQYRPPLATVCICDGNCFRKISGYPIKMIYVSS